MEREPINFEGDIYEAIRAMAEANAGGLSVIARIKEKLQESENSNAHLMAFLKQLDSMNMRGRQIWIAYKDYANQDMDRFLVAVDSCDERMIKFVNDYLADYRESTHVARSPIKKQII